MDLQITVKELNQPSSKALKAFNQYVFEVCQQHEQQNQEEVNPHE